MRKGHRRTQSDIIHANQRTTYQPLEQPKPGLTHLEITQLLTMCNEKMKQKVSNIEVLSPTVQSGYLYFQFGQSSHKKLKNFNDSYRNDDYLACIPEKKQSFHHQIQEKPSHIVKKLQIKDKKFEPVFEQHFRRLPFSDALNSRPRERRKAQPEKPRQEKHEIRNNLGLKLKF